MLRPVFRDLGEKRVSGTGLPGTSLDILPNPDMWILVQPHSESDMGHSLDIFFSCIFPRSWNSWGQLLWFLHLGICTHISYLHPWLMNIFSHLTEYYIHLFILWSFSTSSSTCDQYINKFHCIVLSLFVFQDMLVCYFLIFFAHIYVHIYIYILLIFTILS